MKSLTATLIAGILVIALGTLASAQSSNPAWLDLATQQLAEDKQCEVGFFISMKESKLGARNVYEARAQCVDGRQFDVNKIEPAFKFEIKECNVTVC